MAIIVVGGSGKSVGKTSLVCGIIRALPEFRWMAVKVTNHFYGFESPIFEDRIAGTGTDTARYLAAGAERAFLISTGEHDLERLLDDLSGMAEPGAHWTFESNRVLKFLRPDVFLAVDEPSEVGRKPSFTEVADQIDAWVVRAERDSMTEDTIPLFKLEAFDRVSSSLQQWLKARLALR
jgi:hypothetical protein